MDLRAAISESKPIALPFVVGLCIYTLIGSGLLLHFGKEETHLLLNSWHTPYVDVFFKYITQVGNGVLPVFIAAILLLVRYSWALAMGISCTTMGAVVQTLKRSVFAGDHRPAKFFSEGILPQIDGVELMLHHSFPSGHSATAFCILFILAFFIKQRWATYLFMSMALLAAFSRVYISQHFIQDTIVGSWIGLIPAYLGYLFIVRYSEENPTSKLNRRLLP